MTEVWLCKHDTVVSMPMLFAHSQIFFCSLWLACLGPQTGAAILSIPDFRPVAKNKQQHEHCRTHKQEKGSWTAGMCLVFQRAFGFSDQKQGRREKMQAETGLITPGAPTKVFWFLYVVFKERSSEIRCAELMEGHVIALYFARLLVENVLKYVYLYGSLRKALPTSDTMEHTGLNVNL